MAARCAYHVWEGAALEDGSDKTARHLCDEHWVDWRDGERTGPAHVENSDCKRLCQACKEEGA